MGWSPLGTECQLGKTEGGDGCTTLNALNASEPYSRERFKR